MTVKDAYGAEAEDLALALLSFYGYQRVMSLAHLRDAWRPTRAKPKRL